MESNLTKQDKKRTIVHVFKNSGFLPNFQTIEPISKRSIGLKIKAGRGGQPQTYTGYFEDWPPCPNTDIEFEGTF
jgi:hypothetical protein